MSISQLLGKMKLRFKLRSAVNSARDHAEPSAIVGLLSQFPDQDEAIESYALQDYESGYTWPCLMLCTGLVMVNSSLALNVLRRLLSHNPSLTHPIAWHRLKPIQVNAILEYLYARSAFEEFERLLPHLSNPQFTTVHIKPDDPALLRWLNILLRQKRPLNAILEDFVQTATQAVELRNSDNQTHAGNTLRALLEACEIILASGQIEEVLELLTILSLIEIQMKQATLRQIADALPELSDNGVARAAKLLRRYPSANWVPALKDVWLSIEESVRINHDQPMNDDLDPFLDAATNEVAASLGACAACDKHYKSFAKDEATKGVATIEKLNQMIEEYNGLVTQYKKQSLGQWVGEHIPKATLLERMKSLKNQIEELNNQLEQLHDNLSPGYLLWVTLRNSHVYPMTVRRGAAWGLNLLCNTGHLDEETTARVFEAIRECVEGDERNRFCERSIRLLPGRGAIEMAQTLQDGLQWMTGLVEKRNGEGESTLLISTSASMKIRNELNREPYLVQSQQFETMRQYDEISQIVALMCEIMPGALDFLRKYPLRLMPLDAHKQILGYFLESGCNLIYWTRYTPPKNIGKVHNRYLTIDDRSTPNSMGIYYKLFRHPVLVLPVIYHEFMHYGGPAGDPDQSIANETEVLLREIIFARYLIARLAPEDDQQIPAFEESLVREIKQANLQSLQFQLAYDFRDNLMLKSMNEQIIKIYGDPLSESEIADRFAQQILMDNLNIEIMNHTEINEWYEDIIWPRLNDARTRDLSRRYKTVLSRQWSRDHHVFPDDRDRLLKEMPCVEQIRTWEEYVRRRHALSRLTLPWLASLEEILRLIAKRFDLEHEIEEDDT
jgi:hypothetical protein